MQKKRLLTDSSNSQLLAAVKDLIIPYVRAADDFHPGAAAAADGAQSPGRTVLVEPHPPDELSRLLDLRVGGDGAGKAGTVALLEKVLAYSVNTWSRGFLDKLYAGTNAVGGSLENRPSPLSLSEERGGGGGDCNGRSLLSLGVSRVVRLGSLPSSSRRC